MRTKIFDCTTFYKANLLFETRFNVLKNYVDYFVVCEANKDHVGNAKNFNFNTELINKYPAKIIYIKVENLPNIKIKGKKDYDLLKIQMENLFKGLVKANDEDLILFSDEDEIPNPKYLNEFQKNKYKFGIFLQNMYYYKLNIQSLSEGDGNWPGSRICKKKFLKSFAWFRSLKTKNTEAPVWKFWKEKSIQLIKNGGWHFTYLMKPEEISQKIKSMAHTEFNREEFVDTEKIKIKIEKLQDPFDRNHKLKKVKIDENYPEYIKNNIKIFKNWILE